MRSSALDSLHVPPKRDVKGMTAQLAELDDDTLVTAGFADERYGSFSITGKLVVQLGSGRLIAARQIDSKGTPDATLRSLAVVASLDDAPGSAADTASVNHGDAVTARFDHHLYGTFEVMGVAVLTQSDFLLRVGEWILAVDGTPSPWLQGVRTLAVAGAHDRPVPSREVGVLS